jgi:hypothetical protein
MHLKQWKETTIILLRKSRKNDYSNLSAYKLIALLNTLGKILKAIIARRIYYVIKTHKLFSETQMRVRRERLTEITLHLFTEKIYII